ncbi:hypothetical protein C8Q76DRAFT_798058 [Earliella scabrosa]|nr:hypothetical protein C8Q76DRAFT_798058 [Earliella scabrosa]
MSTELDPRAAFALFLCLLLGAGIYWFWSRPRPVHHVRRTRTLAYAYSATARVQPQHPTYLVFPAPPLPPKKPHKALKRRDFTAELSGNRASVDHPAEQGAVPGISPSPHQRTQASRKRPTFVIHPLPPQPTPSFNIGRSAEGSGGPLTPAHEDHIPDHPPTPGEPLGIHDNHDASTVGPALSAVPSIPPPSRRPIEPCPPKGKAPAQPRAGPSRRPSCSSLSSLSELSSDEEALDETEYLEREWRKQAGSEGPAGEVFYVWFWQTASRKAIRHPPDLSHRPELAENDLFLHRFKGQLQMWVWVAEDGREYRWKKVQVGYKRPSDGRVLTLTEVHKKPSWLEPGWYKKRKNQNRL